MSNSDRNCLTFKWTIEKASFCWHQKGERLESPSFVIKALQETEWCLFMYPRGYQESSFLLYLKRKDNGKGPKEICLDFELSILGGNGSPVKAFKRNRRPFYKDSSYGGSDIPTWDEIFRLNRDSFLPNDTLTICCKMWKIGEEFDIPLQCSARTKIAVEHSFNAKIPNFKKFEIGKNKGILIGSTKTQNVNFILCSTDGLHGDESMFIEVFSTDDKIRFFTFKLYVLDNRGGKVECSRDECGFYYKRNKTWIFPLMFSLRKLVSNILTLQCQCCFSNGELVEEFETANSNIVASKCPASVNLSISENASSVTTTASEVLKSLYTDQILCDVKLRTQMETFPAHRNILSARSPVFRTMFTSDMREKTSQFVDIPDVDADILRYMLQYVYTESLEGLHYQSAYQLYVAADMYQILDLRNKCSVFLRGELSRFNACDVLVLADVYQDKDLKTDVQNFIVKEGKNIFTSDEWKDLIKENIQLAADTMLFKCVRE
ncbi:TD and POZ domain-containing protein 4 [Araneus ventricosus]|uniref:TD and POZ domain-containing protein 4 n=1 Tax=Araneus ventricosus TaxID=182803 RepID=A0A4Y2VLD9_ARAVE|nr:TD and POZ domain-containing protein 4 [Araneus ventricosus]